MDHYAKFTYDGLLTGWGINLTPLLHGNFDFTQSIDIVLIADVLLLGRGPTALISKDKGLISSAPATVRGDASPLEVFEYTILLRVLKKINLLPNLPRGKLRISALKIKKNPKGTVKQKSVKK
jgi:hypothetical protein